MSVLTEDTPALLLLLLALVVALMAQFMFMLMAMSAAAECASSQYRLYANAQGAHQGGRRGGNNMTVRRQCCLSHSRSWFEIIANARNRVAGSRGG